MWYVDHATWFVHLYLTVKSVSRIKVLVLLQDLLCSVVFLVAPLIFFDFMFISHKQTSSSLLWIHQTLSQLILVSNKQNPKPQSPWLHEIWSAFKIKLHNKRKNYVVIINNKLNI